MIKQETKESIVEAITYELNNAISRYGERYNSDHEAWAVLKEELDEAMHEHDKVAIHFETLWQNIKNNTPTDAELSELIDCLFYEILELVQCAAVASKWRGCANEC